MRTHELMQDEKDSKKNAFTNQVIGVLYDGNTIKFCPKCYCIALETWSNKPTCKCCKGWSVLLKYEGLMEQYMNRDMRMVQNNAPLLRKICSTVVWGFNEICPMCYVDVCKPKRYDNTQKEYTNSVQCDHCKTWFHLACIQKQRGKQERIRAATFNGPYFCKRCVRIVHGRLRQYYESKYN